MSNLSRNPNIMLLILVGLLQLASLIHAEQSKTAKAELRSGSGRSGYNVRLFIPPPPFKDEACKKACWGEYDICSRLKKDAKAQGAPDKDQDGVYDECREKLQTDEYCGSCLSYMHIENPIAICLILFFLLLIIGGIVVGVMYSQKKGCFKKQQANAYNPNAQQADPQMSNQVNQSQYGNADQNNGPGQPSQSPTQNFSPQ